MSLDYHRKLLRHRLARMRQLGGRERLLLAEAFVALAAARAALLVQPFPRIAKRLGGFVPPDEARARAAARSAPPEARALAEAVGLAIVRATRHLPFKAVCLPQALAARKMLARRGVASVLHFGTISAPGAELKAHAWLDSGGIEVTGYPLDSRLIEVACLA